MLPTKRRAIIKEGTGRFLFIKHFGKPIEEYETFIRATESLQPKTYGNYRRILPYYFVYLNQTPDQVIQQRKKDLKNENEEYERKTTLYLKSLIERGLSGKAISTHRNRIQGFFTNNGKRLSLELDGSKLKISKVRKRQKYSPSNEEVRLLISKADSARNKLVIAMMYQHGGAPIDISKFCCGDYPLEPWVCVERSRSKTGEIWYIVSTPDVCQLMKAYLNVRGEHKATDRLFVGREGPLDENAISGLVHDLIVSTPELTSINGFKPTSLRDAFEDALVDAEIYHKVKEALMAHNSGIETQYGGTNKMKDHLVEAMKKAYPFICLDDGLANPGDLAGFTKEDIAEVKKLLSHKVEITKMLELVGKGELVHINDPELPKKLRDKGVLS